MLKVGNPTPSQKVSPRRNPRMRNNTCGTHLCQHDLSTNSDQESVKQNVSKKKTEAHWKVPILLYVQFYTARHKVESHSSPLTSHFHDSAQQIGSLLWWRASGARSAGCWVKRGAGSPICRWDVTVMASWIGSPVSENLTSAEKLEDSNIIIFPKKS